jgi:hypothetical protein
MQLASEFEIIKKWGKSITWGEYKYTEEEFRNMLQDPKYTYFNQLKAQIVEKIQQSDIKVEEPIIEEL